MRLTPWCVPNADGSMKCSFAIAKLPQFGTAELQLSAVIQDPVEVRDILAHLVKTGRAPPGFDRALLN